MKSSSLKSEYIDLEAYESARAHYLRTFCAVGRKYINEFMDLKCAPDLLIRGLFPNAKEITESSAVYHAIKYLDYSLSDENISLISVGDGCTPRTAAWFAFRSKWECHSIDPILRKYNWETQRLTCHINKIEELNPFKKNKIVLVAVHSHANLHLAALKCHTNELSVIALPCCVPQLLYDSKGKKIPPDIIYDDHGIWSDKNQIFIWQKLSWQDLDKDSQRINKLRSKK